MKKIINSFIGILVNTVIILALLAACIIGFIFLFSKLNGIPFKEILSFGTDNNEITLTESSSEEIVYVNNLEKNNNQIIINTNNKFYYNQLDDNSKLIYDALEDNLEHLKESKYTIDFSTKFNDLLKQDNGQEVLDLAFQTSIDAFFYDHPELFYIDITKISLVIHYKTVGPLTTYTVSIEPKNGINYLNDNFNSQKDVETAISKIENIKNTLIQKIANETDYNKALKVHDALVNCLEYDSTDNNHNTHNIYGALIEKKVVCEGYAKAFKYILDSLNIQCILVNGEATNSKGITESHMWNYIKLNDNWYGIDVTWDDPIIVGERNNNSPIGHDYFCKGSNFFNESHVICEKISNEGKAFSIPTLSRQNYK